MSYIDWKHSLDPSIDVSEENANRMLLKPLEKFKNASVHRLLSDLSGYPSLNVVTYELNNGYRNIQVEDIQESTYDENAFTNQEQRQV